MRKWWMILSWLAVAGGLGGYLGRAFVTEERAIFLPGDTTRGHHQIESRCEACHTPGRGVEQQTCLDCHGDELDQKADSHAPSRFADPRNADLLRNLDARRCVTCHGEHRPDRTLAMGVTQPVELCEHCHADVADERPSHEGLPFSSCQDAGCHNYHDNRTLNADTLRDRASAPDYGAPARLPPRGPPPGPAPTPRHLATRDADAPESVGDVALTADWAASAHARAGVNCTGCHGEGPSWKSTPPAGVCASCHGDEAQGFEAGLHGMRAAVGLSPMKPSLARLPMRPEVGDRELECTSCHGAHAFDTAEAAVSACLGCHADEHSLAYSGSPHHALWRAEVQGRAPPGSGVSCATCHLPRRGTHGGAARVEHNQSLTLRPSDAMVQPVCSHCHGAPFSLAALADEDLARQNFPAAPSSRAESFELLRESEAKGEP